MDGQELQQENHIKLLGHTKDKKLNVHDHFAELCRKISRQISVFNRFKRLIPLDAKLRLHNSFISSHLNYCSTVWHFSKPRDRSDEYSKTHPRDYMYLRLRTAGSLRISSLYFLYFPSKHSKNHQQILKNLLYQRFQSNGAIF